MLTFRLSTAIGKLTPRTVYKLLWFRILIHLRAADLGLETKNGSGLWWRATDLYNRRVHFLNYEISKLEDKKIRRPFDIKTNATNFKFNNHFGSRSMTCIETVCRTKFGLGKLTFAASRRPLSYF